MHGYPLCKTADGLIMWQFPEGKTGIISKEDTSYLVGLNLGAAPDPSRKLINVIR